MPEIVDPTNYPLVFQNGENYTVNLIEVLLDGKEAADHNVSTILRALLSAIQKQGFNGERVYQTHALTVWEQLGRMPGLTVENIRSIAIEDAPPIIQEAYQGGKIVLVRKVRRQA